ncbi:MAG: hypothetical protein IPL78_22480 [Chloroflexi bacterium]|nr:hypothetical protein [Chloroflexota bacterium]
MLFLLQGKRTVAELERLAKAERKQARQQAAAAAEAKRIRELETLASKAEATWTFIEQLVEQGTGRSYAEATELLAGAKPSDVGLYVIRFFMPLALDKVFVPYGFFNAVEVGITI